MTKKFIHKLAPKVVALAIVLLVTLAISPMIYAQSCTMTFGSNSTIYVHPGESFGPNGTVDMLGTNVSSIYLEQFSQTGNLSLQNLQVGYNGVAVPNQGVALLPSGRFDMGFSAIVPYSATEGESTDVTLVVDDLSARLLCRATAKVVVGANCNLKATEWNGNLLPATFDAANNGYCFIEAVPGGASSGPFIYNNGYYVNSISPPSCLLGSFDGAHCLYNLLPANGFIWNNAIFVPVPCPSGTTFISNTLGCLFLNAPWGEQVFICDLGCRGTTGPKYMYFTPIYQCPAGVWDGAHCFIAAPPAGTTAVLSNNRFYYR